MYKTYLTNGKQLNLNYPQIMGIVNLTPDSFYDGGKYNSIKDIINDAELKITEGATIIDIGAASSKPNAVKLTVNEEIERLEIPLIELRKQFPHIILSVDTYYAEVANFAITEGADVINDISGGELDSEMINIIAKNNTPYIIMHMQGTPQTMQQNPHYQNVTNEVNAFFLKKIEECKQKGVTQLILDVGFGFGKTLEHNFELLKNLTQFANYNFPLLVGFSRKSMINKVIKTNPQTALNGTTVLNTIALMNGANILRVHDVKEAKECIDLVKFYNKSL